MQNPIGNYEIFLSNWLNNQQTLLQHLLLAISPDQKPNNTELLKNLRDRVLSHYIQYYQEKGNSAKQDPFLFLHPTWLSAFERTLLWLGDFKPSLLFKFINNSVADLTPEQGERIERLKSETKGEERQLTETMARVQESLGSQPIYSLARQARRLIDGELSEMEEAVERLKEAALAILERADALRISTAANVVEILSPIQAIRFLATAMEYQLRLRRWGQLRDWQRASINNGDDLAQRLA